MVKNKLALFVSVAMSELAGLISSLFTTQSIPTWYVNITKPLLTPPGWLFGPVWVVLYAMMGTAAYLVWEKGLHKKEVRIALVMFIVQLAFNSAWSLLFFGLQSPGWALIDITLLWFVILATIVLFMRVSRVAAWLLVPYILWVTFAASLNYSIWVMN